MFPVTKSGRCKGRIRSYSKETAGKTKCSISFNRIFKPVILLIQASLKASFSKGIMPVGSLGCIGDSPLFLAMSEGGSCMTGEPSKLLTWVT